MSGQQPSTKEKPSTHVLISSGPDINQSASHSSLAAFSMAWTWCARHSTAQQSRQPHNKQHITTSPSLPRLQLHDKTAWACIGCGHRARRVFVCLLTVLRGRGAALQLWPLVTCLPSLRFVPPHTPLSLNSPSLSATDEHSFYCRKFPYNINVFKVQYSIAQSKYVWY